MHCTGNKSVVRMKMENLWIGSECSLKFLRILIFKSFLILGFMHTSFQEDQNINAIMQVVLGLITHT